MITDGIEFLPSSKAVNFTVDSSAVFPTDTNVVGELFYKTGAGAGLFIYNGSTWDAAGGQPGPPDTSSVKKTGDTMTGDLRLEGRRVYFLGGTDDNHYIGHVMDGIDGPEIVGFAGGRLSTINKEIMRWKDDQVTVSVPIQATAFKGDGSQLTGLPGGGGGASGTVTSINVSGGSTGLVTSGGPITNSGTIVFSGTLAIASGGTGQTTKAASFDALAPTTTAGDIIYHNGTNNVRLAKGANGQVLALASGIPSWSNASSTATNIAGGGTYQIPIQSSIGTTTFTPKFTYDISALRLVLGAAGDFDGTLTGATGTRLSLYGGISSGGSNTAGGVFIKGGQAYSNSGGGVKIEGGGSYSSAGGDVTIVGGYAQSSNSGAVSISGGPGTTGSGGVVTITGGSSQSQAGSSVTISGGDTSSNYTTGGNLILTAGGASLASSQGGNVQISGGTSATNNSSSGAIIFSTAYTAGGVTERFRIRSDGSWALSGYSNVGTAGQVLTASGSGSPTWQTASSSTATYAGKTLVYVNGILSEQLFYTDAAKTNLVFKKSLEYTNGLLTSVTTRNPANQILKVRTLVYTGDLLTSITES